jgi:hypothetical protein
MGVNAGAAVRDIDEASAMTVQVENEHWQVPARD